MGGELAWLLSYGRRQGGRVRPAALLDALKVWQLNEM
jgi:hypothetical protein